MARSQQPTLARMVAQPAPLVPLGRVLTPAQLTAIRSVMRLFVEDDLARGVTASELICCAVCGRRKAAPGAVQYEQWLFCNPCATDYEIARMRALVRTPADYLAVGARSASA